MDSWISFQAGPRFNILGRCKLFRDRPVAQTGATKGEYYGRQ